MIELILGRFEPLPPPDPAKPPRRRRPRYEDMDLGLPFDTGDDRIA